MHQKVFVFGAGKIGTAIKYYMEQAGFCFSGFVTSDSLSEFQSCYMQDKTGIIIGVSDTYLPDIMPLIVFCERGRYVTAVCGV